MKPLLGLVVMHTLDHFWADKRGLGNNPFERNHVVELIGAEGTRVARELAEATNVGTIVHDVLGGLRLGSVCKCADNIFEGAVKGFCEFEGLIEEAVGEFTVVRADFVYADLDSVNMQNLSPRLYPTHSESSLSPVKHHQNVWSVAVEVAVSGRKPGEQAIAAYLLLDTSSALLSVSELH